MEQKCEDFLNYRLFYHYSTVTDVNVMAIQIWKIAHELDPLD